jgi:hypothetical protein
VADDPAGKPRSGRQVFVKDMSITHADFFRTAQPLLVGEDHDLHAGGVTIRRGDACIDIVLGPEETRSIGNFHLPRTRVEIRFVGCKPAAVEVFLARFDTRFRRGGG